MFFKKGIEQLNKINMKMKSNADCLTSLVECEGQEEGEDRSEISKSMISLVKKKIDSDLQGTTFSQRNWRINHGLVN